MSDRYDHFGYTTDKPIKDAQRGTWRFRRAFISDEEAALFVDRAGDHFQDTSLLKIESPRIVVLQSGDKRMMDKVEQFYAGWMNAPRKIVERSYA